MVSTHPYRPCVFFDILSLDALTLFFFILKKYAPVRNTNDGRRFTNEHSLDAFHLARKIALMQTPEALVNEISTNSKSALNLLRVEEKATVVGDSYRWLLLNSTVADKDMVRLPIRAFDFLSFFVCWGPRYRHM